MIFGKLESLIVNVAAEIIDMDCFLINLEKCYVFYLLDLIFQYVIVEFYCVRSGRGSLFVTVCAHGIGVGR